ncbi:MAG TPA: lasso peptide biosynthesis B2 protein [Allosphingosinicella sp.]
MSDWLLLAEALGTLALASLAIRIVPFRRLAAAASSWGRGASHADPQMVRRVRGAVQGWAVRVPWKAVCFQRGLALHFMLRRRGIASVLHYGVGRKEETELAAHVWVNVGGETVIGGEEAPKFACLARFPGEAA